MRSILCFFITPHIFTSITLPNLAIPILLIIRITNHFQEWNIQYFCKHNSFMFFVRYYSESLRICITSQIQFALLHLLRIIHEKYYGRIKKGPGYFLGAKRRYNEDLYRSPPAKLLLSSRAWPPPHSATMLHLCKKLVRPRRLLLIARLHLWAPTSTAALPINKKLQCVCVCVFSAINTGVMIWYQTRLWSRSAVVLLIPSIQSGL